jgi:hypothetical protein
LSYLPISLDYLARLVNNLRTLEISQEERGEKRRRGGEGGGGGEGERPKREVFKHMRTQSWLPQPFFCSR